MHQSPLEKLRALPENKRNAVAFGAATLIAVFVGYAQIATRLNEGNEGSRLASDAPSTFEGLGNILREGKDAFAATLLGIGSNVNKESEKLLKSKPIVAGTATDTGSTSSQMAPKPRVNTVDITQ